MSMPPRRPTRTRALRRLIVALVLLGGTVASTAPSVAQSDDPRQQQEQVRKQRADVANQVDALKASSADVTQALDALQANVTSLDAQLAEAQLAADQAAAAAAQALADVQAAQQRVDDLKGLLKRIMVSSYVYAGTDPPFDPTARDVEFQTLRTSLEQFKVDHDDQVLKDLVRAEAELDARHKAAAAAATEAEAKRADIAARAAEARGARDQQATYVAQVQRRLDASLAEAQALASIDSQLSAQIAAQETALAVRLETPAGATEPPPKPPVPPGSWPVPPRPSGDPQLATTHGITVAASIVDQLGSMLDAAAAAGLEITGSGWRSYDSQVALRRQNCGPTSYDIYYRPSSECSPPTARPGYSMHEEGLAVDLAVGGRAITSHDDPAWQWLNANAKDYGFANLESEPWHWSTNGS